MTLTDADVIAICDLAPRMYAALDRADPTEYAGVFASDGEFVTPFMRCVGRGAIAAFLEGRIAQGMTRGVRYFVTNAAVAPHPDGATYSAYLLQLKTDEGPLATGTGAFVAVVVRERGKWLFRRLELTIDQKPRPA